MSAQHSTPDTAPVPQLDPATVLPADHERALLVGRVWDPETGGPRPSPPPPAPARVGSAPPPTRGLRTATGAAVGVDADVDASVTVPRYRARGARAPSQERCRGPVVG